MLDTPVIAHAEWDDHPDIVAEVDELRRRFSDPALSVPHVLCDAHPADDVAFRFVSGDGAVEQLTYGELADRSRRLAAALREHGISRGDRVAVLMPKTRQLPVVLLAIWRLGAVQVPLFTAFAGPAIASRVHAARAKLIVSDPAQLGKLAGIDVDVLETGAPVDAAIAAHEPLAEDVAVGPDGLFLQLYTSGTTGTPKGVGVPAFAIGAFLSYMRYGLGVRADDVFWNPADPGWAYGLYYGIVGPLALGIPNILLAAGFSPAKIGEVVERFGVTNLAASPTMYRAMKKDGVRLVSRLRAASSAGEPLTPDVTAWAPDALGCEVRDHWGQTEHGMAIVNAWEDRLRGDVRDGSMGPALPGFRAGTLGQTIVLSVPQSPLMWFSGYVDDPERSAGRFTDDGDWYLSGDVGRSDGSHLYFSARDDDVILAAGYRIAPFDLEAIIVRDPAVAEVAVVGRPDEIRGEVVEAFVVLADGFDDAGLEERLQLAVRQGYGAHAYPRRVHVIDELPKTPSGKVQRFLLRVDAR